MKKVKFLVVTYLMVVSSILGFSGCEKRILMDEEKCAEVALEYLENKYQTEFEVLDSVEVGMFIGKAGYAEVRVRNKSENTENEYVVVVYPDGSDDKDDDGYYDAYKVISDTYMCYLLQESVKSEMDKLLVEAGLTKFISTVSIEEGIDSIGFLGFSNDFMIQDKNYFLLNDILDENKINIRCRIKIPESQYSDMIQSDIISIIKPLISDDFITFNIDVYDEEIYKEVEELNKNNRGYDSIGINSIYFSVQEEKKENEFK